jgi:hypothetical protein
MLQESSTRNHWRKSWLWQLLRCLHGQVGYAIWCTRSPFRKVKRRYCCTPAADTTISHKKTIMAVSWVCHICMLSL